MTATPDLVIDLGAMQPPVAPTKPRRRLRLLLVAIVLLAAFGLGYAAHTQRAEPIPAVPAGCERAIDAAARYIGAHESAGQYVDGVLRDIRDEFNQAVQYCPLTSG